MIKLPYEQIVEKLIEKGNLSKEEIEGKIKAKMDQLSGLISKDGAAHIIANELGVNLFEEQEGKIEIKKILAGMKNVETVGKVINVFEVREFTRKDGNKGKVGSFIIGDKTGSMRVTLWNDLTELLNDFKVGDIVHIKEAYSKENQGKVELQFSGNSELIVNPEGEKIEEVKKREDAVRKKIEELKKDMNNVEILGTIVQIFEPRFYEICPECNKRAKLKDENFACDEHGNIIPKYGYVMNAILDDGTETIRVVFFRNQMLNLLGLGDEEVIKFKDNPGEFQTIKEELLGKIIKIVGRAVKNEMFDRVEFISQLVFPEPDASEELKRLEEEAKVIE